MAARVLTHKQTHKQTNKQTGTTNILGEMKFRQVINKQTNKRTGAKTYPPQKTFGFGGGNNVYVLMVIAANVSL